MNRSATSLRWAAAILMGTLVVGSGVATAVVASSDGSSSATEVEITPSTGPTGSTTGTTATTAPVATTAPAAASAAAESETAAVEDRYWGPECGGAEATNHGQYVSSAEKGGAARSVAAQSDCAKPSSSVGDSEESDDADEAPELPEAPTSSDGDGDGNGNGTGNGKGKGRGNAK